MALCSGFGNASGIVFNVVDWGSRSKEEAMQELIKMENPTIFLLWETKKKDRDMQKLRGGVEMKLGLIASNSQGASVRINT